MKTQYTKGRNIDVKDMLDMLKGNAVLTTNFPEEDLGFATPDQTMYEFQIHKDRVLYRNSGTTRGCFWTGWKDYETGFPPEQDDPDFWC